MFAYLLSWRNNVNDNDGYLCAIVHYLRGLEFIQNCKQMIVATVSLLIFNAACFELLFSFVLYLLGYFLHDMLYLSKQNSEKLK